MADDDATSDEEEFAREGLRIHNEYRRKHGVPDLKLSKSVRFIAGTETMIGNGYTDVGIEETSENTIATYMTNILVF
jgi:uncharacterized protein YkwD